VKETRNRGWWLPAGALEGGESFLEAAHRETLEEAGIEIDVKGILRIEHSVYGTKNARMRVIFFAMPKDEHQKVKTMADSESEEARWVSLEELKILSQKQPGLRGPELYEWGSYIENGGLIAPMSFLCREDDNLPEPTQTATTSVIPVNISTPSITPPVSQTQTIPTHSDPLQIQRSVLIAIEKNDDISLRKLLLSGFDPNLQLNAKQWIALFFAIKYNHEFCVNGLLIGGSDLSLCTHKNRNAIHFAAQSTPTILSMILLRLQALPSSKRLVNSNLYFQFIFKRNVLIIRMHMEIRLYILQPDFLA
jgi:ADP-ribose pyrophosphatase YjhB (NUDIX family)